MREEGAKERTGATWVPFGGGGGTGGVKPAAVNPLPRRTGGPPPSDSFRARRAIFQQIGPRLTFTVFDENIAFGLGEDLDDTGIVLADTCPEFNMG